MVGNLDDIVSHHKYPKSYSHTTDWVYTLVSFLIRNRHCLVIKTDLEIVVSFGLIPFLEWFSNDLRKTNTKAITPINHNRGKQGDEPIRTPSFYLGLAQSTGKPRAEGAIGLVLLLIG